MTVSANIASVDILSDALDTLDAGAAVFFRGSLAPPWTVLIPQANQVLDLMGRPAHVDTVLMFHAVVRGSPTLQLGVSGPPTQLQAGDLVLLNLDQEHRLGEGRGGACLTMESIVQGHDFRSPLVFDSGAGPHAVKLICGGFFLRNTALHPLVSGLPPLTRVRSDGHFDKVAILLSLLAEESESGAMGSRTVVRRLADLLLVEMLRSVIDGEQHRGWLSALSDPVLRRALGAVHADPAADWSVPDIARAAGVSASGLTVRFRQVLGQPPARYLTHWRMHLATRLLQDDELSLTDVAERVGYGSVEAFSRTFKRTVGRAPGLWRHQTAATVE